MIFYSSADLYVLFRRKVINGHNCCVDLNLLNTIELNRTEIFFNLNFFKFFSKSVFIQVTQIQDPVWRLFQFMTLF